MKVAKKIIVGMLAIGIIFFLCGCGASWKRVQKNWDSNIDGGLNREITVYDYNGNIIKKYQGKCDIQTNENKVLFDLDGKRIIIYNAIVIAEEK